MEMTDIQTDRLTIIHVSSVEIGRTRNGKCTKNDTTTTRNRPCYVGHCSNRLHRRPRYMYRYIWIETSWFLMKKTDIETKQPITQTNRQTAHNRRVFSSNRSYTSQKTETRKPHNMWQ